MRCPSCNALFPAPEAESPIPPMVANDNRDDLPNPLRFAAMVAEFVSVARSEPFEMVEFEAKRMKLIEAYERAYSGR